MKKVLIFQYFQLFPHEKFDSFGMENNVVPKNPTTARISRLINFGQFWKSFDEHFPDSAFLKTLLDGRGGITNIRQASVNITNHLHHHGS